MPNAKLLIKNIRTAKQGSGKRGPWTLYAVDAEDESGKTLTLTTFDSGWAEKVNQLTEIEYEITQRNGYENLRIVDRGRHGGSVQRSGESLAVLKEIRDLLRLLVEKASG